MHPDCDLSGVGVLILGLLVEQPMHPYQAFQTLEQRQDTRLVRVNAGAVYHSMERLERTELVVKVGVEREGRRPERTTYAITDRGREVLTSHLTLFLSEELPSFPMFMVGLAEAHHLGEDQVVAALRQRQVKNQEHLDRLQAAVERLTAQGLPRRYLVQIDFEAHQRAAEIQWIDTFLADLTAGSLDWESVGTELSTVEGA